MGAKLLVGDVFDRMAELPDGAFDMILTSPPFLALRSYLPDDHPDKVKEIGSEATPAEFLDTLLELTAVWRRLLAPHGSLVVELGDTYAGSGGAGGDYGENGLREGQPGFDGSAKQTRYIGTITDPSNPAWREREHPLDKSLCGIPTLYTWSLAYGRNLLTGQESPAGMWRIRNLKPWIRTNPPVGALGDKERPATSYITVATLARDRWFDLDAVRTPVAHPSAIATRPDSHPANKSGTLGRYDASLSAGAPPLDWVHTVDLILDNELDQRAGKKIGRTPGGPRHKNDTDGMDRDRHPDAGGFTVGARGHHLRRALERAGILTTLDALDISPKGYAGAHYAVWPPQLCQRLIAEMCPRRVCLSCGEPSRRLTETTAEYASVVSRRGGSIDDPVNRRGNDSHLPTHLRSGGRGGLTAQRTTLGWSDCGHNTWRPGHVLDPFAGSGTTLAVATGMGRNATGIDLDPRSADLARERCGMFLEIDEDPARPIVDTAPLT